MDVSTLTRRLHLMRQHLVTASFGTATGTDGLPPDMDTFLDQVSGTLEFLYAAEDHLKTQNQEIQAARQLVEHQYRRYRELFDGAPDAYVLTDTVLLIREVNHAAVRLLGRAREQMIGQPILSWIEPGERSALNEVVHRLSVCAEDEALFDRELRLEIGKQSSRAVELSVVCNRDRDERLLGFRWAFHDVTQRKRTEEALRHEKEFAESLIRTAQAAVLVVSPDGRVLRCNPYLVELCGLPAEALEGRDWLTLLSREAEHIRLRELVRLAHLGLAAGICTAPLQTLDGRERLLRWSARSLPADGGAILLVGHDVTDLEQAQRRALQAERLAAIGQMMTGLAHESRNALQRGQACLEMLALEVPDRPRALDLITRLQEAQDHLLKLYEEVRQFAAPVRLERKRCDLATLWRQAWDFLDLERKGRRTELREETAGVDLSCRADPAKLRQVFRNIFENALAAVQGPVQVQVACAAAALTGRPAVELRIRDNGPGLTPEQRQRIFEPFYTTKTRGTGIGMTIVRSIVEAHDGQIRVGADTGCGTEIIIILPGEAP